MLLAAVPTHRAEQRQRRAQEREGGAQAGEAPTPGGVGVKTGAGHAVGGGGRAKTLRRGGESERGRECGGCGGQHQKQDETENGGLVHRSCVPKNPHKRVGFIRQGGREPRAYSC